MKFVPPDFGLLLRHLDYICEENIEQSNEDHQDKFNSLHGYGDDTSLLNARWAWTTPSGSYEFALWGKNSWAMSGYLSPAD